MFSATGTMNLQANLTPGEIIEQVLHASRVTTLRGLVFMGIALDFFNLRNGRTAG
jgi:adenine C2-methylase RlmN of 23S rRNA A2503 and tRNA A37